MRNRKRFNGERFSWLMFPLAVGLSAAAQQKPAPTLRKRPVERLHAAPPAPPPVSPYETVTLPSGIPLRVQLNKRYRMRAGQPISGVLIDDIYSGNYVVLPKNSVIDGKISGMNAVHSRDHTWNLLDGDFTPMRTPALQFTAIHLPDGKVRMLTASATERTAPVVNMTPPQHKQSLWAKAKAQIGQKISSVKGMTHDPHKSDAALKMLYGQLPYHPQEIWPGTQFDAVLDQPLQFEEKRPAKPIPLTPPKGHLPAGKLEARLVTPLSSATNKVGNPIEAVLTQPYMDASRQHVILPTGTELLGVVTQAKPARKLGHNGTLRFAFRNVKLPNGALEKMHGQMTAVEGRKGQNVTVDSEGGAKANADQGKFLAPIVLGALAGNSLDADQGNGHAGVASNGFGLIARGISMAFVTPAMTAGFAYFAVGKSITRRWLEPGHNVVFAKNTRMQLSVADR
jgi:hypothetical protein